MPVIPTVVLNSYNFLIFVEGKIRKRLKKLVPVKKSSATKAAPGVVTVASDDNEAVDGTTAGPNATEEAPNGTSSTPDGASEAVPAADSVAV